MTQTDAVNGVKSFINFRSDEMLSYLKFLQEIGYTHMRIVEGVDSLLQLSGLLARLCKKVGSQ